MKIGQLIDCNINNVFLEKSCTTCGRETIPRLFSKKIKIWHTSGSIVRSCIQFVLVVSQVEGHQNILKVRRRPLTFTSYKGLCKTKTGLERVSLPHFLHDFEEKYFSCCVLLPDQISLPGCIFLMGYWAICALQVFVNQIKTS